LDSYQVREKFLSFFEGKGHQRVKSAPLVPHNDPSLLFVNAGMVQFKNCFLGREKRSYKRATSCQKCVRAGGKHNDLEQVGYTARHHTFFEMLGNFSFGDYFKKEAIEFGWEFITKTLMLPPEKLWITVYKEDDEAFDLWHKNIGVPERKIIRMGEKDNFWSMGDTGPCGPCSEIHIDQGDSVGCGKADCSVECECDRFLELWNLVFMQFNRDKEGNMTRLPKPSIDTGLGLERVVAIMEGVNSNFDTDLFMPIIKEISNTAGIEYGRDFKKDVATRVIADHLRASLFLLTDGVFPDKSGRGYVLRRIIRRAVRYGKLLNFNEPFIHNFVDFVVEMMSPVYPELIQSADLVKKTLFAEQEQFYRTLDNGLAILDAQLSKTGRLDAKTVFKLYDTYGFPVDLTRDIAKERNIAIDMEGFEALLKEQKERSKTSWAGSGESLVNPIYSEIAERVGTTKFVGYELDKEFECKIEALIADGISVDMASSGRVEIISDRTPFYGRSGGQIGDSGKIVTENAEIEIDSTIKESGIIIHKGRIVKGTVAVGEKAKFIVDIQKRESIRKNHTATHLLQAALRKILGETVHQAGSLVTSDYLRFDFTYAGDISQGDINAVERLVNKKISKALPVVTEICSIEEAYKSGATALFGEKYSETVRVVSCGDFSKELCGGTHVRRSSDIGLFVIKNVKSVASGIKRIEAMTGDVALNSLLSYRDIAREASKMLSVKPTEINGKIAELIETIKRNERRIKSLQISKESVENDNIEIIQAGRYRLVDARVNINAKEARAVGDHLKQKITDGIICIINDADKRSITIMSSVSEVDVSALLKKVVRSFKGKGGGNRHLAQGTLPKNINLDSIIDLLKSELLKM